MKCEYTSRPRSRRRGHEPQREDVGEVVEDGGEADLGGTAWLAAEMRMRVACSRRFFPGPARAPSVIAIHVLSVLMLGAGASGTGGGIRTRRGRGRGRGSARVPAGMAVRFI